MSLFMKIAAVVPHDKALHFGLGYVCALPSFAISKLTGYPAWAVSLTLATAAGILKDLRDLVTGKGTFDPWDIAATALGGVPQAINLYGLD